jgi:hypothetical protein
MVAVQEQVANADLAVGEVEETHLEKLSVAPWNSGMADDFVCSGMTTQVVTVVK